MNSISDANFQNEVNEQKSQSWMVTLYCAIAWICLTLAILQVPLVVMISNQCITIEGISTGGKRYQTDSLSCKNPLVQKLWERRAR